MADFYCIIKKFSNTGVEDLSNWNKIIYEGISSFGYQTAIDSYNNLYVVGYSFIKKFDNTGIEIIEHWPNMPVSGATQDVAIDLNNNVFFSAYKWDLVTEISCADWLIKKFFY